MKKINRYLSILALPFFALFFSSCGNESPTKENSNDTSQTSTADTLLWEKAMVEKSEGDCKAGNCIQVSFQTLKFISGNKVIDDALNAWQEKTMIEMSGQNAAGNLNEAGDKLIHNFLNEMEYDPEYMQSWEMECVASIDFQDTEIISLSVSAYTYFGGAHPNSDVAMISVYKSTGKMVTLEDLVSDTAQLRSIAQEKFKAEFCKETKGDCSEAGFDFGEEDFPLAANFEVTEKGILFFYNQYEIAPYAMGTFDLTLEWKEIESILKGKLKGGKKSSV